LLVFGLVYTGKITQWKNHKRDFGLVYTGKITLKRDFGLVYTGKITIWKNYFYFIYFISYSTFQHIPFSTFTSSNFNQL